VQKKRTEIKFGTNKFLISVNGTDVLPWKQFLFYLKQYWK